MDADRLLDGRLKLRHLRIAVAIEENGSVTRAAESLHTTQPVVSRALHELEEILDVPLFERYPRGVSATVYGRAFVDQARAIIGHVRHAGQALSMLASADLGTITVGTHLAGSNVLLPRAIAEVKRAHPRLTVVVREAPPDLLWAELLAGGVDMTIGRLAGPAPAGLAHERLYAEPIRLVTRARHPALRLARPTLAQLLEYSWILPVEQTALRSEVEAALLQAGAALPTDRVECTSILTTRYLLTQTDMIGVLPLSIAAQDRDLALLATRLPSVRRSVGVTVCTDRQPSPGAQIMLAQLRREAAVLRQQMHA